LKPRILSTRRRGRGAAPSAGAALASDSYTQLVVQYVYVYVYCSKKVLSHESTFGYDYKKVSSNPSGQNMTTVHVRVRTILSVLYTCCTTYL
jgi:ABC-type uncharacterized transport system permease subunit